MADPYWCSKDRFAAKRLSKCAKDLTHDKRAVIEKHSAFRSLLNISPFNVPNELIDFVAVNRTCELREFNYHRKRKIVFTKEMVSKVFDIRSGNKPVKLLTKSMQSDLRDSYRGDLPRLPIENAATMLKNLDISDEDGEAKLEPEVVNKKKKKDKNFEFWVSGPLPMLAIVYMDHLDIPKNEKHVINYSCPRACFVTSDDFHFVVKIDLDVLMLGNKTVFARRPLLPLSQTVYGLAHVESTTNEQPEVNPSASLNDWLVFPSMQEMEVPDWFKNLYNKHKFLFASDVDATMKTFGSGIKSMQSARMSCLLNDIDAAMREEPSSSVVFPTSPARDDGPSAATELDEANDDEPEAATDAGAANDVGAATGGSMQGLKQKRHSLA
ncbi:unnamed protein product [Alopecurus aequalis]